jgi:tetratricopeptide (TPR) repeat protein
MAIGDPETALAGAQWMTAGFEDPVQASCHLALARIDALMKRDSHPDQLGEVRAAVAYLRERLPADDQRLLLAEKSLHIVISLRAEPTDEDMERMRGVCEAMERVMGTGSSAVVNAYWNLAYAHANRGEYEEAYRAFLPHLWPTYRRQSPRDGLRPWYLAYFAPIAFRACDLETAYATAVTQINGATSPLPPNKDNNCRLSARVLAAVLAEWGDEAGAAEVERDYGIERLGAFGRW